jgi:UDP-N-acetylglucosamine--N-acetylmuramyl-(pentapeptide) pyrophosphoryl-undecaprenol N-acetylglucosamine transferase
MAKNKQKIIILSGGGTAGSVSPLLAIHDELRFQTALEFLWIGTRQGPEEAMAAKAGLKFFKIFSGKLRRYFSWKNFSDSIFFMVGFFQALLILIKFRPKLVMSAGGFVSVPVAWSAWLLGIPVIIHQQDVVAGLANRLMAPIAKLITVSFETSLKDYGPNAIWTGNPVRKALAESTRLQIREDNLNFFKINNALPVILVFGGGTGSMAINQLVSSAQASLKTECNIIHLTGARKTPRISQTQNYYQTEFLEADAMARAYSLAEIVVSRCGMGALTELAFLGKASILIPMPDSHQENNAQVFANAGAAIVLSQNSLNSEKFRQEITNLLADKTKIRLLQDRISVIMKKNANQRLARLVQELIA